MNFTNDANNEFGSTPRTESAGKVLPIAVGVWMVCVAMVNPGGTPPAFAEDNPAAVTSQELMVDEHGYLQTTFQYLSNYDYVMPTEKQIEEKTFEDQVPGHIKDLNGKKIAVEGFLLPSEFKDDRLKKLVLFSTYLGCCFGNVPEMNEWIYVDMKKAQELDFFHGMAIKVYGTLEVGETVDWDGGLSLYRMSGDKIESPLPKKKWYQFWK